MKTGFKVISQHQGIRQRILRLRMTLSAWAVLIAYLAPVFAPPTFLMAGNTAWAADTALPADPSGFTEPQLSVAAKESSLRDLLKLMERSPSNPGNPSYLWRALSAYHIRQAERGDLALPFI